MLADIRREHDQLMRDIAGMGDAGSCRELRELKARVDAFMDSFYGLKAVCSSTVAPGAQGGRPGPDGQAFEPVGFVLDTYCRDALPIEFVTLFTGVVAEFYALWAAASLASGRADQALEACAKALAHAPRHQRSLDVLSRLTGEAGEAGDADAGSGEE